MARFEVHETPWTFMNLHFPGSCPSLSFTSPAKGSQVVGVLKKPFSYWDPGKLLPVREDSAELDGKGFDFVKSNFICSTGKASCMNKTKLCTLLCDRKPTKLNSQRNTNKNYSKLIRAFKPVNRILFRSIALWGETLWNSCTGIQKSMQDKM